MKLIPFAFVCLALFISTAAISVAQSTASPEIAAASQPTSAPATTGQTDQSAPPAKPSAGQPAQTTDQTQNKTQDKNSGTSSDASTSGTSKDRLFFALPNFLTVENSGNVAPLTAGEKFKVVARGSFDPIQLVWYGALSSICQAENCEPGFGQGWEAYGKRYGAYAADGTIENFFVGAIFPSMLHQDPRYFQLGKGGFFHRTEYAVSRILVTRTDSGHHQFNFSEIVGAAVASAISTYSYHPHPAYRPRPEFIASDRTFKNTASVWGSQVGYDTVTHRDKRILA